MMITMRSIGSDLQKAYELAEMYLLPRKNEHKKHVRLHKTIIEFPKISIKTPFFGQQLERWRENSTNW